MSCKKKFVILGAILLVLLSGFFFRLQMQSKGQHEKAKGEEAKQETVTEMDDVEEQGTQEAPETTPTYQYKNLDGLYFLNKAKTRDFKKILGNWVTKNKFSCSKITILGDITPDSKRGYRVHLQLDDELGTILEVNCSEQGDGYAYDIKRFTGKIKNIEQIGGVIPAKERAISEAPADGYVPDNKPTDDSDEIILENAEELPKSVRRDEKELKKRILEELKKEDDLRRVFTVQNVQEREDYVEFDLIFKTVLPSTLNLEVTKDLQDGKWILRWN